jgi:2-keto-4-pentenoate hydratase
MTLEKSQVDQLSRELMAAESSLTPIDPITDRFPEITIPEAYAIQLKTIETKVKSGAVTVGKKIGLTSNAMQEMFGVREPDYGHILNDNVSMEGQPIPMSRLIQPRVESEICFLLKKDLKGPGVTTADVLAATAGVIPAFEVIDSRIKDWRIKIQDTIADNASNALVVLGGQLTAITNLDLRLVGLVLERDGDIVATAAGAAVWGNPVQAVAWLANALGQYGISLRSGEFIMSGSLTAAIPAQSGSSFRAIFDHLGSVTTRFVSKGESS